MQHLRGQSLIELLIAVAVGTLMVLGAVAIIIPSLRGNTEVSQVQVSSSLGRELLENVRVYAETNWPALYNLQKGSGNSYFLDAAAPPLIVATGTEGVTSGDTLSGLVGYWKLDEATGTVAYDFSRNNNVTTSSGGVTRVTGEIGGAFNFNGSTGFLRDIAFTGQPLGNSGRTISAWINVNPGSCASVCVIAFFGQDSSSPYGYGFYVTSAYKIKAEFDSSNGAVTSNAAITASSWHHIVATYNGSVNSVYIDGALDNATNYSSANTQAGEVDIGQWSTGAGKFAGSIDDVRIYNRALSSAEIVGIYKASIFTRSFYVENVGRDGGGYILSSGGTNDPSTQKVTVVYGAAGNATYTISEYLTRSVNNVFDQTDWSGGAGQDGPITTMNSKFASSTNIDTATTTGSVRIKGI